MPDRVYPGMHAVEPPKPQATIDRAQLHPPLQELGARHHPVLVLRRVSHQRVRTTSLQ
jgi:hypothetical protein